MNQAAQGRGQIMSAKGEMDRRTQRGRRPVTKKRVMEDRDEVRTNVSERVFGPMSDG